MAIAGLGSGCATTEHLDLEISRLRKDVRRLEGQLTKTRADLELVEGRVTLLSAAPRASAQARVVEQRPAVPKLPVVRLPADKIAAPAPGEAGALDDGGPPLLLRLGREARGDKLPVDHRVLQTPDPVLGKQSSAEAAKREYEVALATLREQNNPVEARRLFDAFARAHPNTTLTDNAAYWQAECSFAQGAHAQAIDEFLGVVEKHPRSNKVPDALLRVAQSWQALGKTNKSVDVFERIVDRYPESEAANAASAALASRSSRNGS